MLYFVCSYPENSQKMIGLKYLYVGLILSIYNRGKSLTNKLVLHQIVIKLGTFLLFFSYLYLLNVSGMVWLLWRGEK